MAEITLNVPNAQVARVVNALCVIGRYDGDPTDQVARREFARGVLRAHLQKIVLEHEMREAAMTARAATSAVVPVDVD